MQLLDRAFAAAYARMAPSAEQNLLGDLRRELLAGIGGHVVDVGAGLGANLDHLGSAVERVTLLEPSAPMAERLRAIVAAGRHPFAVDVIEAPGEAMPLADDSADAVLCTLVLCTVEDPERALAETRRVLRPDGQLALLEHVRADGAKARVQETVRPVWRFFGRGCDPARRTGRTLVAAGFDVGDVERHEIRGLGLASPALVGISRPG